MGFFGGQITFAAVLVQFAVAFGVGFILGAGVALVAIEGQCPAAWELIKKSMGKKKHEEDTVHAESC